jgi:hypothetical protein
MTKGEGRRMNDRSCASAAFRLRLSSFVLLGRILNIQRHPHPQPRQVGDEMKDMSLDPAEAMQRKDDAGQHRHA